MVDVIYELEINFYQGNFRTLASSSLAHLQVYEDANLREVDAPHGTISFKLFSFVFIKERSLLCLSTILGPPHIQEQQLDNA